MYDDSCRYDNYVVNCLGLGLELGLRVCAYFGNIHSRVYDDSCRYDNYVLDCLGFKGFGCVLILAISILVTMIHVATIITVCCLGFRVRV